MNHTSSHAVAEPPTPLVYSVEEAARSLRVSRDMMYTLIRSGRVRTMKVGRRRLVPRAAVTEFILRESGLEASA